MKQKLDKIEEKINELISLCDSLKKENRLLKKKQSDWTKEKRLLLLRNDNARQKIESMIERLKTMENLD